MATLAETFVAVRPDMDVFGPELNRKLAGVDADPAGRRAGSGFVTGFGKSVTAIAGIAAGAFAAVGAKDFLSASVKEASSLNEQASKASVLFGSAAGQVQDFAKGAVQGLGQSQVQATAAASKFAVFGKSAGLADSDLAGFSTGLVTLSSDLASFNDSTPEEAINAIGSALAGETEPLKQFGVLLDDASLRAKALELGLTSTTKNALTPQQKVLAAHALILERTGTAQGDFARTSDSLANVQRRASAAVGDLKIAVGTGLLPIVTQITALFADRFLPALTTFAVDKAPAVQAGFTRLYAGAAGLLSLLGGGNYTGALQTAFGWQEDSTAVDRLLDIRDAVTGLGDLILGGRYDGALERAFGWEAESPAVARITQVRDAAIGLADLLFTGDYNIRLWKAFGWEVNSPAVEGIQAIQDGARAVFELLTRGDYSTALRDAFGWEEDGAAVGFLLGIRDSVTGIGDVIAALDFSSLTGFLDSLQASGAGSASSLGGIGQSLVALAPAFGEFLGATRDLALSALPFLDSALGFLADNVDTVIALMPLLVAAFAAYKVALAAVILKQIAQLPLTAAQIASNFAMGQGASALAAQLAILNGVQQTSTLAKIKDAAAGAFLTAYMVGYRAVVATTAAAEAAWTAIKSAGTLATLRSTAALVASRVAMIAGTVATYAMAAASAVLSAVMSANPIGLVVAALVALVAGLVIAYRESETFRAVVDAAWAAIKTAVSVTIDWLITAVPAAFQWVLNAFQTYTPLGIVISHWDQIRAAVGGVVDWLRAAPGQAFEMIKTAFLNYTPLGLVISHWDQIRGAVGRVVDWLRSAPGQAFEAIKSAFLNYTPLGLVISHWDQIRSAVSTAASGAKDRAIAAFTDLRSGVTGKVGEIVSTVQGLPGRISSAIGDLGSLLYGKGQAVVQGLIDGLRSRIAAIGSAANELTRAIASRLPGSPVKEGPLRVLNNGYAGGQIARMLADGITSRGGLVQAALESSLVVPPVSAAVVSAAGTTRASGVTSSLAAAMDGAGAGTGQVNGTAAAAGPYLPSSVVLRIGDQEFIAFVEDVSTSKRRRDSKLYQGSRS